MTITRPQILLTIALGLVFSVFSDVSAIADGESAAGHDHEAMMAEKEISEALAGLSAADRRQAEAQRFCPIMQYTRLGATDTPHKVMVEGTPIFVCCEGCVEHAEEGGKATLAMVMKLAKASATLAKLPAKERAAAEAQKYCAIANKNFLGSMGAPIRLELDGNPVYLCCKGCVAKAKADPAGTLAKAEALKKAGEDEGHGEQGEHDHHEK
ncbi:MAG: hypothetical protein GXP28_05750 [Planctomycetes bacterium]|nr:hypothetical protein [Planctomycetota bacterium]